MHKISVDEIKNKMFELADDSYKTFQSALIPNIEKENFIGVRVPQLRNLAKELLKHYDVEEFLQQKSHQYYEENQLHGFFIEYLNEDFDKCLWRTENFIPLIDNWAVCDSFKPMGLKKDKYLLYENIKKWMESNEPYKVRLAIVLQISWFLNDDFEPEMLEAICFHCEKWVANMKSCPKKYSDQYYVLMAVAWYFSVALVNQFDESIGYFLDCKLPKWIHNKALQKALESKRFSEERKEIFRNLKIKD